MIGENDREGNDQGCEGSMEEEGLSRAVTPDGVEKTMVFGTPGYKGQKPNTH